jgi:hypothetical protein
MNFLLYHKDLDEKEKPKDNNSNEEIKDNNIFEEKKDEDNNNNKEDLKIEQKKENHHIDENIFKKSSKRNRINILNINSERENKNEINNINEKNNNIENIKDNILKKEEEEFKILNINQNNQGLIKNSRTKVNKKNEFPKHNSMKEFNHANLLLTTNIINRIATKKKKNSIISTKKTLVKPKTYNYLSPKQIQDEEDIDYNENKKEIMKQIVERIQDNENRHLKDREKNLLKKENMLKEKIEKIKTKQDKYQKIYEKNQKEIMLKKQEMSHPKTAIARESKKKKDIQNYTLYDITTKHDPNKGWSMGMKYTYNPNKNKDDPDFPNLKSEFEKIVNNPKYAEIKYTAPRFKEEKIVKPSKEEVSFDDSAENVFHR